MSGTDLCVTGSETRQLVERDRAIYVHAFEGGYRLAASFVGDHAAAYGVARAAELFPLPKVSRPRVVHTRSQNGQHELHIRAGRFGAEYHYHRDDPGASWNSLEDAIRCGNAGIAADILVVATALVDLKANPTELVDDDGSAGGAL